MWWNILWTSVVCAVFAFLFLAPSVSEGKELEDLSGVEIFLVLLFGVSIVGIAASIIGLIWVGGK